MKKRTVLHILNGEVFSGVEQVVVTLLSQLDQSRYRPHVITLFNGLTAQRLRELGIGVDVVPMKSRWNLRIVWKIQKISKRIGASLIHAHTIRSHLVGSLAALSMRIPIVVHIQSATVQESERKFKNRWNAFVESKLKICTACYIIGANSLRTHLRKKKIPDRKIIALPNAIDVQGVVNAAQNMEPTIYQRLNLNPQNKLIGMGALFRYRKGAEILLQAVKILPDKPVPYKLIMIGQGEKLPDGGNYVDVLKHMTKELDIEDKVIYIGFQDNWLQWLKALDVFILPSRFGEGLPIVVLEAMALGVPVVATPVEGTAEVLEDGVTGFLPPVENPKALADAIHKLLTNPEMGKQMARKAFEVVRANHDAPVYANKMADIYDELLA